jgi:GNAT superfamily N-acetyltransferase
VATTLRTYLQMKAPPSEALGPAPAHAVLRRVAPCPLALYRQLYERVGGPWQWFERRYWHDARLEAHLALDEVRVVILEVAGQAAGYYELATHREQDSVEIAYFGLVPEWVGKGLGGWFLRSAIADAWSGAPSRVWLHTCGLDHPAALPNYLRRGFEVTHTEVVEVAPEPVD